MANSDLVPTYPVAVIAGLLSFLSPCVLPLFPVYQGDLSAKLVMVAYPASW